MIISLLSNYVTCGPEQRLTKGMVLRMASSHHLFLIVNTVYIVPIYVLNIYFLLTHIRCAQYYYIHLDNVSKVTCDVASNIAVCPDTFYLLDGLDADPLLSKCMMLFIASPVRATAESDLVDF